MRTRDGFHSGASLLPVIIKPSSHISDREKSYDEGKEIMIREVLPDPLNNGDARWQHASHQSLEISNFDLLIYSYYD